MYSKDTDLKQLVVSINSSLYQYDRDGYSYVKRSPTGELENTRTLRAYLEARLNLEFYYLPGYFDLVKYFDGHLWNVTAVDGLQEDKKRFDRVHAELDMTGEYFLGDPDQDVSCPAILDEIRQKLGGTRISFGYSQRKIRILIE